MEKLEKVDHQDNSVLLTEKPLMNNITIESSTKTKIINIPEDALDLDDIKNKDNHKEDEFKILVTNE